MIATSYHPTFSPETCGYEVRYGDKQSKWSQFDNGSQSSNQNTVNYGFWSDKRNRVMCFSWLESELVIKKPEDWYKVNRRMVIRKGGRSLLEFYTTIMHMLHAMYPDVTWHPWRFENAPSGFWSSSKNQMFFLEWLSEQLHVKCPEEWANMKASIVSKHGGKTLLLKYGNSIVHALETLYPEYNWQHWTFERLPNRFLQEENNQKNYLDWLSKQLYVQRLEDWYDVSWDQLARSRGAYFKHSPRGLYLMLKNQYPEYPWKPEMFVGFGEKSQQLLYRLVKILIPKESQVDIQINAMHPEMYFPDSLQGMSLDVYIPSLHLAFEYQGEQHYRTTSLFGDPEGQKGRDTAKRRACADCGITLIEIPFWWSGDDSSVIRAIRQTRPDIELVTTHNVSNSLQVKS